MASAIEDQRDQQAMYRGLGESGDAKSYTVAIVAANTAYSTAQMAAGVYRVWMPSGSPADVVVVKRSATASTPSVNSPDASGEDVNAFPADAREYFRVTDAEPYLWVKTLTGTGTLYFGRLGP